MATSYAGTQRKRLAIVGVTAIVVVAGVTGVVLFNQSSSVISPGAVAGPPGVPTSLSYTGPVGSVVQANFSWKAPTSSGASAITSYNVRNTNTGGGAYGCAATPPAITCSATLSGGSVSGYTWTVTAKNAQGTSAPSVAVTS